MLGRAPSQLSGGTVTVNGSSFDPTYANNTINLAGLHVPPLTCTATMLTTTVPFTAATGTTSLTVNSNGLTSNGVTFAVRRVSVTSVSPAIQMRGGNITMNGTDFDPACNNNVVTLAGINIIPATCTVTALFVQIPAAAAFGDTRVSVSRVGLVSNDVPFTVARQPGAFVEITDSINSEKGSPRTCSAGEVRLALTGSDPYTALFTNIGDNTVLASVTFDDETPTMSAHSGAIPETLSGAEASGSACARRELRSI